MSLRNVSASSSRALPWAMSLSASSKFPRCTALIALAENRITSRDMGRACSRERFRTVSRSMALETTSAKADSYDEGIRPFLRPA